MSEVTRILILPLHPLHPAARTWSGLFYGASVVSALSFDKSPLLYPTGRASSTMAAENRLAV
jgi:hypothetical protein